MSTRQLLVVAVCATVVAGVGSSAALAGEVTGNGKPLWTNDPQLWDVPPGTHTLHGKSECAYSGQEDDQFPGTTEDPNRDYNPNAGHSQSWGQVVKGSRPVGGFGGFNPGLFCNPTKSAGSGV